MQAKVVKVSFNLPEKLLSILRKHASYQGISMTEAVRRAISIQDFIAKEMDKGHRLLVEGTDKQVREVLIP
jgi:hypothetical protein